MGIFRYMQRMVQQILAHDVFQRFRKNRPPAPARVCKYGHAVFAGNNRCSYGHHGA